MDVKIVSMGVHLQQDHTLWDLQHYQSNRLTSHYYI